MKRRVLPVVLVTALFTVSMVVPVAADDGGSLWDALTSIFSFFGDLIGGVIDVILSLVDLLLDGLKYLFIPRENYFIEMGDTLHSAISEKFGGILSMIGYLKERFNNLRAYNDLADRFILRFPSNSLFANKTVSLLDGSLNVMDFIRTAFTGFVVILTFAFCKRKAVEILKT